MCVQLRYVCFQWDLEFELFLWVYNIGVVFKVIEVVVPGCVVSVVVKFIVWVFGV